MKSSTGIALPAAAARSRTRAVASGTEMLKGTARATGAAGVAAGAGLMTTIVVRLLTVNAIHFSLEFVPGGQSSVGISFVLERGGGAAARFGVEEISGAGFR